MTDLKGSCPAWFYYSKADQGAELQKKLEAARERKMLRGAELRLATEKGNEAVKVCTATKDELSAIAPTLREIETQIGDYRNALHAAELWDEKAKGRAARDIENGRRILEMGELEAKLELIAHDLENVPMVKEQIGMLDRALYALTDEIGKTRTVAADAKAALQRREDLGAALELKRSRQTEHRGTITANNVKREAWEILKGFTHPTGAPYLLMEKNVGYVQHIANELLSKSGSDLRVRIESITPTQKGEARDKISVYFTDSRGENQLRQASGEQSVILSMALGPALSIAGSEFCGATPYLYAQDEGWDRLDMEHREILRSLVAEIAGRFGWFLFIAHLDWLISSADHELRVVQVNGKSELQG